jgi:hypothetical protein
VLPAGTWSRPHQADPGSHDEAADVASLGDAGDDGAEAEAEEDEDAEAEVGDLLELGLGRGGAEAAGAPQGASLAEDAGGGADDHGGLAPDEGGEAAGEARGDEQEEGAQRAPGVLDVLADGGERPDVEDEVEEGAVEEAGGQEAPPLVVDPDAGELEGAEAAEHLLGAGEAPEAVEGRRGGVCGGGEGGGQRRGVDKDADRHQRGGDGGLAQSLPPREGGFLRVGHRGNLA